MTDTRPVWLTREQRDALTWTEAGGLGEVSDDIVDAWDAAPADSTEAAAGGIANSKGRTASSRNDDDRKAARRVLAALGRPGS